MPSPICPLLPTLLPTSIPLLPTSNVHKEIMGNTKEKFVCTKTSFVLEECISETLISRMKNNGLIMELVTESLELLVTFDAVYPCLIGNVGLRERWRERMHVLFSGMIVYLLTFPNILYNDS